jgi:hypothetical protein
MAATAAESGANAANLCCMGVLLLSTMSRGRMDERADWCNEAKINAHMGIR